MTDNQYQELIEFLTKKFSQIDERLKKLERNDEARRDDLRGVAEGVAMVNERLDRFQDEVRAEFKEVRAEFGAGFRRVWEEFDKVHGEIESARTEFRGGLSEVRALVTGA